MRRAARQRGTTEIPSGDGFSGVAAPVQRGLLLPYIEWIALLFFGRRHANMGFLLGAKGNCF